MRISSRSSLLTAWYWSEWLYFRITSSKHASTRILIKIDEGSQVEDVVANTTRALAPILLPLIEAIGGLSLDDL